MAEPNTAEVEATVEAAFIGAGSDVTLPPPGATVVEVADVVEAPVIANANVDDVVVVPVVVPAKPQYVRLTKEEWNNTKAAAGKVAVLESRLAKFEGSMPKAEQIVQQVIESVRAQTPVGTEIDPQVLADAFADQEKDFPELAGQNRKAIEHVLKNLRGIAPTSSPAPTVDVNAAVEKVLLDREVNALAEAYPDWPDIVGRPLPGTNNEIRDSAFRQWLAKEPATYQQKVNQTRSPAVLQAAIARFESSASASPQPTPSKAEARRAVIEDAVTPRADGSPPPLNTPMSAEEAFGKAFKKTKRS